MVVRDLSDALLRHLELVQEVFEFGRFNLYGRIHALGADGAQSDRQELLSAVRTTP
jgi:hypothetical protein